MNWPGVQISLAGDFPAAWAAAVDTPELILCDLGMPGATPLAGISGVIERAPQTPVIVITANEDDELLLALFEHGIAGFISKTSTPEIIEAAIRLVIAGGRYIPQRVFELANERADPDASPDTSRITTDSISRLSERQLDVLRLIANGESNKEIARSLNLSPSTAKAHAAAAMMALGTANRAQTAFRAREIGLI